MYKSIVFIITLLFTFFLNQTLIAHEDILVQIKRITEKIKTDSNNTELFLQRGELYMVHQDWDKALSDFFYIKTIDSTLHIIDLLCAKTMLGAKMHQSALIYIDNFLTINIKHPDAYLIRARILTGLNKPEDALKSYNSAIKYLNIPVPDFYLERAELLSQMGNKYIEQAIAGLDEGMVKLGPIVTLQLRAIDLEIQNKSFDRALDRLNLLIIKAERKEKWLAQKGGILELSGQNDKAREAYKEALEAIEKLSFQKRNTQITKELEATIRAKLTQNITNEN